MLRKVQDLCNVHCKNTLCPVNLLPNCSQSLIKQFFLYQQLEHFSYQNLDKLRMFNITLTCITTGPKCVGIPKVMALLM